MLSLAITFIITGAALVSIASLIETGLRLPGYLRQLEAERQRLERTTTYTGPLFNRHGREIERN